MTQLFRVKPSRIQELVAYSEKNLWKPHYPKALVQRFLTTLISSDERILELHDSNGRVAVAVLLDRVTNPANDACLEILGIRSDVDSSQVVREIVRIVLQMAPKVYKGFQIGLLDDLHDVKEAILGLGLSHYYDTYEMRGDCSSSISPGRIEIRPAVLKDRDQVYPVLYEAFSKLPDASLPEPANWQAEFLSSASSHFYVWIHESEIVGFANLVEHPEVQETELRTVGVLSGFRGRGIGGHLLYHCLAESRSLGYKACRLTVAATNKKALALYVGAGLKAYEKFSCFRSDFLR